MKDNMIKKWIIGTGFSRGIGAELVKQIHGYEYQLLHIGRKAHGSEDEFLECDLSQPLNRAFLKRLKDSIKDKNIHGFLYGAGIFPAITMPITCEEKEEFWKSQAHAMQINYLSCAQLLEEILPSILNKQCLNNENEFQTAPFIAHINSLAAVDPLPGFEFYGITKMAILKYFECLSHRFDASKLLCLSLHPGTVKTDMLDNLILEAQNNNLAVNGIFKQEILAKRVISAHLSAQLIAKFLFDATLENERKAAHGKMYLAPSERLYLNDK